MNNVTLDLPGSHPNYYFLGLHLHYVSKNFQSMLNTYKHTCDSDALLSQVMLHWIGSKHIQVIAHLPQGDSESSHREGTSSGREDGIVPLVSGRELADGRTIATKTQNHKANESQMSCVA